MRISAFVSKYINWNLASYQITGHCHASAHTGVAISIEFQAAYRHPFVGAVIDRPPGRARTQVVTNLVYNRFCPFNFGMIATGNHQDFDSLRAAPPARYRFIL